MPTADHEEETVLMHGVTRKRLLALLASGTLAAAAFGAPAASARDDSIASFDGTTIALHFFAAAGLAPGAKAPTVMFGPGWGSGGATDPEGATDTGTGIVGVGPLRHAGYNVLTWDPRGFGSSGGTVEVDSPDYEGRDAQALIDYIARQPEAQLDAPGDPRLGMSGGSYGGGIQLVTAALDKRVDVIVPDIAWHSLVTSLDKEQTVKSGWATILTGLGESGSHNRLDPVLVQAFTDGLATGTLTQPEVDYFASRGPADLVSRIKIPTLLMQGTVDTLFTLQEAVDNYTLLARDGAPLKMLWFCGGHGACLTDAGDLGAIERDELAWLGRYLKRDTSVDTGPGFEWVDQDGHAASAGAYPPAGGPSLTGDGSGTLPLVNGGGSGPATYNNPKNPTGALGAAVAATKAANAVNVTVPAPKAVVSVLGAPHVTLTYTGTGTATTTETKVFAQVVDDATGKVLGNQVTPIPVTLDGRPHTVSRPLEIVAATAKPGETFTLQVVASTTAYNIQRSGGAVDFSKVHVELPTVTGAGTGTSAGGTGTGAAGRRACSSRRRFTVHVKRRYRHRVRRVRVVVAGRTVRRLAAGRSAAALDLRGRPPGPLTVRLVMTMRSGRTVTDTRHYRLCAVRSSARR